MLPLIAAMNKGLDSPDAGLVAQGDTLRREIATFLAARRGANPGIGR